jgi:ubiquinone/menaquinone biosynthesis C-methylase UbiE
VADMNLQTEIKNRKDYWEKRYLKQGRKTVGNSCLTDDEFKESIIQIESLVFTIFKDCFGFRRVLDFGCGWGRISKILVKFCSEIYGIDLSEWPIEETKRVVPTGIFQIYDGKSIPFKDKFFGGFITWTVLQHIHPVLIETICFELNRVTDIGSKAVIYENTTDWAEDSDYTWFRSEEDYKSLFPNFRLVSKQAINWLDGKDSKEIHTLFIMEKIKL